MIDASSADCTLIGDGMKDAVDGQHGGDHFCVVRFCGGCGLGDSCHGDDHGACDGHFSFVTCGPAQILNSALVVIIVDCGPATSTKCALKG